MSLRLKTLIGLLVLCMSALACSISFGGEQLSEEERLQTAVAETVSANQLGQLPIQATPTSITITIAPTFTQTIPPTQTPRPCNKGSLVSESPRDYAKFAAGEDFDKTWRIRNDGTCTWSTSYRLEFKDGSKMGGPSSKNLTQNVAPGESIDIIIDLEAPDTAGIYRGNWQLVDDKGQAFYFPYVIIEVEASAAEPSKPDLVIAAFQITPEIPTQGENTHVKVRPKNIGGADSGGFKVEWYGLDTFTNPSCTWNVTGGLAAGGSVWLECDFIFGSWYPITKTTIVYVDKNNTVDESNENNNTATKSPLGVHSP